MLVPTDLPSVSIILPTYNRSDVVRETLARFRAQDYPAQRLEVLVADNSSDDTPAMVDELARDSAVALRLVRSEERLPAVKRNQALRAAEGRLVIFMNDDVWVRPDFVRTHVAAHSRHEGPVAVVGLVEQSPQMPSHPFTDWYQPFAYDRIADQEGQSLPYYYFWSMNLSLPRDVMLERNLVFHEDWGDIGHEDIELGYRWTNAGYPVVFEPRAVGEHYHPHDLGSACRLQASIGRGLRDLEVLIPDPGLHERYGVLTRNASLRGKLRMGARLTLFNPATVKLVQAPLERLQRRSTLAQWAYWKVMLHHTQNAYRTTPRRHPVPTPTRPAQVAT